MVRLCLFTFHSFNITFHPNQLISISWLVIFTSRLYNTSYLSIHFLISYTSISYTSHFHFPCFFNPSPYVSLTLHSLFQILSYNFTTIYLIQYHKSIPSFTLTLQFYALDLSNSLSHFLPNSIHVYFSLTLISINFAMFLYLLNSCNIFAVNHSIAIPKPNSNLFFNSTWVRILVRVVFLTLSLPILLRNWHITLQLLTVFKIRNWVWILLEISS